MIHRIPLGSSLLLTALVGSLISAIGAVLVSICLVVIAVAATIADFEGRRSAALNVLRGPGILL